LKSLLYIGNKLTNSGLNVTTIDTLSKKLQEEGFSITSTSSKKNQIVRLFDMMFSVLKNYKVNYVLIDTYSTSAFWCTFL